MTEFKTYLEQITKLQEDIRKLGPKRRKETLGLKKLAEVETLYEEIEKYVSQYSGRIEKSEVSVEDSKVIQTFYIKITDTYNKILSYYKEENEETMASKDSFDLKTAVSLLPAMNGSEAVTNQLIDGVELYSTMIKDTDAQLLINFVLKTRLSQSAKLRLSGTYDNVKQMVDDMKMHLLTKKSATALQKQIMTITQGHKTIEQFGQEIEGLFVNLTISQANGNTEAYSVLKPLNEKTAINRFAQGLRNDRLNTIISARGYSSLKDAIQGAKDEEVSVTPSTNAEQIFYARGKGYNCRKPFNGANYRKVGRYPRFAKTNSDFSSKTRKSVHQNKPRGSYNNRTFNHGRKPHNFYRRQHQINAAVEESDNTNYDLSQFFREQQLHSDL